MDSISDTDLAEYLSAFAPVGSYYLTCLNGPGSESICYLDVRGAANVLVEERDAVFAAAVEFLRKSRVPIFDDISRLKSHEMSIQMR